MIYSDECSVEQEPAGQQRWVFSTPGQERWHVDCVNPVKHRQVKLMVWGCFWHFSIRTMNPNYFYATLYSSSPPSNCPFCSLPSNQPSSFYTTVSQQTSIPSKARKKTKVSEHDLPPP